MTLRTRKIISLAQDLAREGIINSEQLASVMEEDTKLSQTKPGAKDLQDLGEYLVSKGYLTEKEFNDRLARKAGIKAMSLTEHPPDFSALKALTPAQVNKWRVVPVTDPKGRFLIATADPFDLGTLDEVKAQLGKPFDCVLASKVDIDDALTFFLTGKKPVHTNVAEAAAASPVPGIATEVKAAEEEPAPPSIPAPKEVEQPAAKKPVIEKEGKISDTVRTVDQIFESAMKERASDIHLEPSREGLKVRFRIDGNLELHKTFPPSMQAPILSRVKIIGGMDVAEQRLPQDGRTSISIGGDSVDVRIASYPTLFGEAAAIRLLSKKIITLDNLGFSQANKETVEAILHKPHGIFLVTGPTGSGKTTTLYAGLQCIDRQKHHVLSVEDPVENEIEGVAQTQINTKAGVTFAVALRSMLRQDPDVIMLGEIRDQETADIALRAAMTGHLVLSTLHTNTAISAIARLVDLGVEHYLISSTLLGVIAQRLVRRLCQHCKEPTPVPPEALRIFGPKGENLRAFKGKGCDRCGMRGFSGRVALVELIKVDDEFRVLITTGAPEVRLREKASTDGFKTMLEDGIDKIRDGITTVEEVLKVCGAS